MTFLVILPLTQVMVTRSLAGDVSVGEDDGFIAGIGDGLGFAVRV